MKKLQFFYRIIFCLLILSRASLAQYHWYKGNVHTHTIESDGDLPLAQVMQTYKNLHYDFLVITDHNMVTPSQPFSTDSLLLINGEEVSSREHWGALGLNQAIDPNGLSRQNIIDRILQQNAIPVINHPRWAWIFFSSDDVKQLDGIRHLEILNTLTDQDHTNGSGMDLWDDVLTRGRKMYGIAADDFHYLKVGEQTACGISYIMVRSTALQQDKILDAIRRGDFYASTGATFIDLKNDNGLCTVSVQDGAEIQFIGAYGQPLKKVSGANGTYQVKGNEGYVRVHGKNRTNGHAWSQPLYFLDPVLATWRIMNYSGNHQSAFAGTPLAQPLQLKINNTKGESISGVNVVFKVLAGGGRFGSSDSILVMTDDDGFASATPILGPVTGDSNQVFRAYVPEVPSETSFKATALPRTAAKLVQVSGNNQSAKAGQTLPLPLVVMVVDSLGNAVAGQAVAFKVSSGDGKVNNALSCMGTSNSTGQVSVSWTLGNAAGRQSVEVSSIISGSSSPVIFIATAQAEAVCKIRLLAGDGQTSMANHALATKILVQVTDAYGNGLPGSEVMFRIKSGNGAVAEVQPLLTGADGKAAATWLLGPALGVQQLEVMLMGGTAVQLVQGTATPTIAKTIAIARGNDQVGTVNNVLADSLMVIVRDETGGAVQGYPVQFGIVEGQGSLISQNPDTTDARGCAAMMYRAGNLVGRHTIKATTAPAAMSVNFSCTVHAGTLLFPLDVRISETNPAYLQIDLLSAGMLMYSDRAYRITQVPDTLNNLYILKTANNDKSVKSESYLTLTLDQTADIYIGYDQRITTPPDWLRQNLIKTSATITASDLSRFSLWHRTVEPGKLVLGSNLATGSVAPSACSMYTVLIKRRHPLDHTPPAAPQGVMAIIL
jgi:hypothetical protein